MIKIVFIRGAPAVGKTTITQKVMAILKDKYKLTCAYVSEDDFRKQMQYKYKAKDLIAHKNSVELIKAVILKLLELDAYNIIFVEGQFRYKEVIDTYLQFIKSKKFDSVIFQFELDLKEMKRRDVELRNTKSKDIEEVKKDIDLYTPPNTIKVDSRKSPDEVVQFVLKKLV